MAKGAPPAFLNKGKPGKGKPNPFGGGKAPPFAKKGAAPEMPMAFKKGGRAK